MADDPPKDLCDAIAEGRALIVCGAGVSRAATDGQAPGWAQLIKDALAEAAKRGGGIAQPWAKACEALISSDQSRTGSTPRTRSSRSWAGRRRTLSAPSSSRSSAL